MGKPHKFDREKKIYRSGYGEVDIQSETINRYLRNLRQVRRLAGNPIPKRKPASCAVSAILDRERARQAQ